MMTTEEAKRLEAWIMGHERDWETICGRGKFPITGQEFMAYYHELMGHGLECIVLVLLTCHGYAVQDQITERMAQLVRESDEEQLEKVRDLVEEFLPS